ncbi:hypothetical protein BX666DRAFT_695620 [Dichotomocladium elegans]|nr:hypothetical protein BX666DRAFT_695620 [Dichotomocladium elegans]
MAYPTLTVLQESFVTNPLPDAAIRARLARDLGVTERTIQIWFQNRRAKARKLDAMSGSFRKSGADGNKVPCLMPSVRTGWIEPPCNTGTPHQRYQATFRTMMTPERFEELHNNSSSSSNSSNSGSSNCSSSTKRRPRSASKPEQLNKHVDFDVSVGSRAVSEGMPDRMMPKQGK